MVMFQWAYNYFTRRRGARLITGDDPVPPVEGVPAALADGPIDDPPDKIGGMRETQIHQSRSGKKVDVTLSPTASH